MGLDTFAFQCLLYLIVNGVYLPFALAVTNDEITGKTANLTYIKQYNVDSLLLAGSDYCFTRYL
jgi:hypothetical protein